MFIKSFRIGFIGLILLATSAWAATSAIQGVVTDAKGKPIKGADVRIETKNGGKLFKTVKTDANGRYVSDGLAAGVYRVTLVVNGAVKASINNTKTKLGQPAQLNFDLKPAPASRASAADKKGKHMVWVPAKTGSHIGGGWVEVPDTGSVEPGALNVQNPDPEQALRNAQSQARGSLPGAGPSTGP